MMSPIEKALVFAQKAHQGQRRKGSDIPYIFHPVEVAQIVMNEAGDQETVMAALLHDVLEDTPVSLEELAENFSKRVCELVTEESENKTLSWKERKDNAIRSVRESEDEQLRLLALADKLSNLRAVHRDLKTYGDDLWKRFNEKDPRKHEWYYRQMGEAFSTLDAMDSFQEYRKLLDQVF